MDNKIEFGFITSCMVYNDFKDDIRHVATLARSLKLFGPDVPVAVMVNDISIINESEFPEVDYIIEMPFNTQPDARANDWQLYWATPFEKTIFVDAMSLISSDITYLFDLFSHSYNLCFLKNDYRFNGIKNHLVDPIWQQPGMHRLNPYLFYFDQSEASFRYFKMADPIFQNWKKSQEAKVQDKKDIKKFFPPDIMHSIVCSSLGDPEDYIFEHYDPIKIVNMKIENEIAFKINTGESVWVERLNYWINDNNKVKIQNYFIENFIYYGDRDFLTEDIYEKYRIETERKRIKQSS